VRCRINIVWARHSTALIAYLAPHKVGTLPWLNRAPRVRLLPNKSQRRRIERNYASNFVLIDSLRRRKRERDAARIAKIAAE
jgi:hypothetical protein